MADSTPHPSDHPLEVVEEITQVITKLSEASTIKEVADIVSTSARRLAGSDGATFMILEDDQCHFIDEDAVTPLRKGQYLSMDSCLGGQCIQEGAPIAIRDVDTDKRVPQGNYDHTFVKSALIVPIRKVSSIGAIGNYWAQEHKPTNSEIRSLQALADSVSVAIRDIELRNSMEKLVEERTRALQAVNDELQTFAYTVAHELKNPLAVVKTNTWSLKEIFGGELSEKALLCVSRAENAANRMRNQIDNMLSMYRVTKHQIESIDVDLSFMGLEIFRDLQEAEPLRKVSISVQKQLSVYGDDGMLRVVLENLINNAWKYTSKVKEAQIELGLQEDEIHGNVFFIKDNGAGFDMENARNLFGVFQRFHSDEEFSGTGVGLASAQRIINKHGGQIWAEAAPGKGATFFFTLPAIPVLTELEKTLEEMAIPVLN
jgi:signal transduction histidine kinase